MGDYSHSPNYSGVKWFFRSVFLKYYEMLRTMELALIGMNIRDEFKEWEKDYPENIKILGFVEDLNFEIGKAVVVINPIVSGGGMRGKVLEAMAAGKTVISTSMGAEGLSAEHMKNIIIADTPFLFAKMLSEMFNKSELCNKIGREARELVVERFDTFEVLRGFSEKLYFHIHENQN